MIRGVWFDSTSSVNEIDAKCLALTCIQFSVRNPVFSTFFLCAAHDDDDGRNDDNDRLIWQRMATEREKLTCERRREQRKFESRSKYRNEEMENIEIKTHAGTR